MDQLTDDIAANRVPGGSAFARAAAELIMLRVTTLSGSSTLSEVRVAVDDVARWVAETKPSMAVVRNVADLARTVAADAPVADGQGLQRAVADAMRDYIARSERAMTSVARFAGEVVRDGATVLVHSYSASLAALLRSATDNGTNFRLLVTESRPYRESRRLIEAVADSPVDITLYSDAAVAVAAESADLALVGADSVFMDGSFANKTGSLPLALACREGGVPLYVATELAKVYFGDADDIEMEIRPAAELAEGWSLVESGRVRVWNQFFERVDSMFVQDYVTEAGLLPPSQIGKVAARSWQ
jgi:translation initiation factor 2B subunit (eIF-2B alpha/beta/delta family)